MEFAQRLLWVALVLGLLAATAGMLSRKRGGWWSAWRRTSHRKGEIELIDRLPLTPQHSVHLLRVGSRTILVCCQPGGATVLTAFEGERASGAGR
jgi:flagellar biogenesis protein FliO